MVAAAGWLSSSSILFHSSPFIPCVHRFKCSGEIPGGISALHLGHSLPLLPMPAAGDEDKGQSTAGRELMDLDLDLDLDPASWPFDPIALITGPPSPSHLTSSSPRSLLQFPFLSPPNPLWLFEDTGFDASNSLLEGPRFVSCEPLYRLFGFDF